MSKAKESFIAKLKNCFDDDSKISEKTVVVGNENITIFFIENLIDKKMYSASILEPIERFVAKTAKSQIKSAKNNEKMQKNILDEVKNNVILSPAPEDVEDVETAIQKLFAGAVLLVTEKQIVSCPAYGLEARGVTEPPTSRVVKGPREGFVEDLPKNLGLIRKRIKTPNLKIKDLYVGKQTNTHISVVYLDGIAKKEIVNEAIKRIKEIDIDGIIDSYYIESFLETDKLKFFKRVGNTEKPDIVCSKLLEGRVAILVDGSPIALTIPFVLLEDLQSAEDYFTIPAQATFVRIMRFIGLIFAILIPGVYVALQSFNYRILPINFLITLLSSIEGLSVPPLIELLLVLFLFEIITEASLQMPNSLGMALSIIGALALGNTAVDAGIISPPSIVIVAISSVALYIIPDQISETRLLRILFTAIGGIIGLYGIIVSFIILTTYLTSITSFGVPYLSPIAPNIKKDKKDTFFKQPIQDMDTRPVLIAGKNKTRQGKMKYEGTKSEIEGENNPVQMKNKKVQKSKINKQKIMKNNPKEAK